MNSSVLPYLKIHGNVNDIKGENTIIGKPMRNNLLRHQCVQDFLVMTRLAKKPARMKNNGIRQICMKWKMVAITFDELSSAGQNSCTFGRYGNAACKTMPRSIATPLNASNPWYRFVSSVPTSLTVGGFKNAPHPAQSRQCSEFSTPHVGQLL